MKESLTIGKIDRPLLVALMMIATRRDLAEYNHDIDSWELLIRVYSRLAERI